MANRRIAACLLLAVMADLTCGQTKICGLDNYDVGSLLKQPYWFAKVPQDQCMVQLKDGECYLYFSVCENLSAEVCGLDNTGFCQKISDGSVTYTFDTGLNNRVIKHLKGTLGFQILYQNGSKDFPNCDYLETIVFFNCDTHEEWDISNRNVTEHVTSFVRNPTGICQFILQLNYSGACIKQTPIIDVCSKQETYDLKTLSGPEEWIATVPDKFCIGPISSLSTSVSDHGTCDLLFSFCKPLPDGVCYNSVFCQTGIYNNPISYGSYNHHLQMVPSIDGLSFSITNYNGTATSKCPKGYFSTVIFHCDPRASWSEVKDHNVTKYMTADPDLMECEYIIRFQYRGACPHF